MRKILFSSVLLTVPLAAVGADQTQSEQQGQQTQQQQQGQQSQVPQSRGQQAGQSGSAQDQSMSQQQRGQQSGQGSMQEDPSMSQQAGGGEADVNRAQFTSNVENREPVDEVDEYQAGSEPLFFFTQIENGAGQTITHRWLHEGEVVAEVPLEVGSDSWRTWSSKELTPELEGEWTVEVVDAQGNTITEESITVEGSAQTQNVGFSPDDQQTQDQQGQTTQSTETEATTGTGAEVDEVSQEESMSDTLPEESGFETDDTAAQEGEDNRQGDEESGEDY